MSELDLGQHSDLKVSELLDRAQLDVVRNGTTKTVAVKDLLHQVHGSDSVASAVAKAPPTKASSQAAPAAKSVINPAMSMSSFRTHENMRLKKQAEFQQQQQRYLQQGGAPQAQDYW